METEKDLSDSCKIFDLIVTSQKTQLILEVVMT